MHPFALRSFLPLRIAGLIAIFSGSTGVWTASAASNLDAGVGFAAVVTESGNLATWGKNDVFQLGHSFGRALVATPSVISSIGQENSWAKVSLGADFSLALSSGGKLYAWGNNSKGQLGSGSLLLQPGSAQLVALPSGAEVVDFVTGQNHAVALVDLPGEPGVVFTWGENIFGQLGQGDGDFRTRLTPSRVNISSGVTLLRFRAIGATNNSSFAIATDGSLWAWGSNLRGELGQGRRVSSTNSHSALPVRVGKSNTWTQVVGGGAHVLALQSAKLFTWGDNSLSQCGRKSATGSSPILSPTAVSLPKIKGKAQLISSVAAGDAQSLALTSEGRVYSWGLNASGELGRAPVKKGKPVTGVPTLVNQDDPLKSDPSKRIDLPPISAVAVGNNFSIFLTSSGEYLSYGGNLSGQLGTGIVDTTGVGTSVASTPLITIPNLAVAAAVPVSASYVGDVPQYGLGTTLGNLSLVVRNNSAYDHEGEYTVSFHLSEDAVLNAGDRLLVAKTEAGLLLSGQSRSTSFPGSDLVVPYVTAGNYFLLSSVTSLDNTGAIIADAYSPDNGASTPVGLVGPDLAIGETISIANPILSETDAGFNSVSLVLRNLNIGKIADGRRIVVEAFLSFDDRLVAGEDVLLASKEVSVPSGGLVSGATMQVNFGSIPVPAGTDGGDYKLIFAVNRGALISESGTERNLASISVRLATHDLAISTPGFPSGGIGIASTLSSVTTTVRNLGARPYPAQSGPEALSYRVELYFSYNPVFDFTATEIAPPQSFSDGLVDGASKAVVWRNVTLPPEARGTVYFITRVVPSDSLGDRVPLNNVSSATVELLNPKLEFSDFRFNDKIDVGQSLGNVSYTLRNVGAGVIADSRPLLVEVYVSTDSSLDRASDILINSYYLRGAASGLPGDPVLGAGVIRPLPETPSALSPPSGLTSGNYYLIVVANGDAGLPEVDAASLAKSFSMGSLDLVVSLPSLSGGTELGTGIDFPVITVSLSNAGGFAVGQPGSDQAIAVKFSLSSDNVLSGDDFLLGSVPLNQVVGPGESAVLKFDPELVPDRADGTYYIIASTVLPSNVQDDEPLNNQSVIEITITRPRLALVGVSAPINADLNVAEPVLTELAFSVVNEGRGVVPAGLLAEVFISSDNDFNPAVDALLYREVFTSGLNGSASAEEFRRFDVREENLPLTNLPLGTGTATKDIEVGGSYFLFYVINSDGKIATSNGTIIVTREIFLDKENAPGVALDYAAIRFARSASGKTWTSVVDVRASNAQAFQSPVLEQGESASVSIDLIGPTQLRAPWRIVGQATDRLYYTLDGALTPYAEINGNKIIYELPAGAPITIPSGLHTVTWTYVQGSTDELSYARLDLDVPSYTSAATNGSSWTSSSDPEVGSKEGPTFARTPELPLGGQAFLSVPVSGPALVKFWWRTDGVDGMDLLTFSVNGRPASYPTNTLFAPPSESILSGPTSWRQSAFLIPEGAHLISWNYVQGSENLGAFGAVDRLEILNPIPAVSAPVTEFVPERNVDLAITSASVSRGTYLLDDAEGSSRLPVFIEAKNVGSSLLEFALSASFEAPFGANASAFVNVSSTGSIESIDLLNGGSGYVAPVTVIIPPSPGGVPAVASATISDGAINSVALIDGGVNYTSVPQVAIVSPNGSGAQVTARLGVRSVTLLSGGSGFVSVPTVSITGGGGAGARAEAVLTNGSVSEIIVNSSGADYTSVPMVTITGGGGTSAAASASLGVTMLSIKNGGSGYSSKAEVVVSGGGGNAANLTVATSNGAIKSPVITSPGVGYTSSPDLSVTGFGIGAELSAFLSLESVLITDGGAGYSEAPEVVFVNPGHSASATAILNDGVITGITLDAFGDDYNSAPAVVFEGGAGRGALAVAKVGDDKKLKSLDLIAGGGGYAFNPSVKIAPFAQAKADAYLKVNSIRVTGVGSGYEQSNPPKVLVVPPEDYVEPRFEAVMTDDGRSILDVIVVDGGSGAYYLDDSFGIELEAVGGVGGEAARATASVVNGQIGEIIINSHGSGYSSTELPKVSFVGGGGRGAFASASFDADQKLRIEILSPGFGYTSAPAIVIDPPSFDYSFLEPVVVQGKIVDVKVSFSSPFYQSTPKVRIKSRDLDAFNRYSAVVGLDPVLGGVVTEVRISPTLVQEILYKSPVELLIGAPNPDVVGAKIAAVQAIYEVGAIGVSDPGFGYRTPPLVSLSPPDGVGTRAVATSEIDEGVVVAFDVSGVGSGYTSAPTVSINPPPELPVAKATVKDGEVISVNIENPGNGFVEIPPPTFVSAVGGFGAVAIATGKVSEVYVVNGGSGYGPILSVSGGGGSGAMADVTVADGVISSVSVVSAGSGYSGGTLLNGGLDLRLSSNPIFGDADDISLGSFALRTNSPGASALVFDSDINLPFQLRSGDYFLLASMQGFGSEFTMSNNTRVLSGITISRAPDLIVGDGASLPSSFYPYHPEDSIFINYDIHNRGLGSVLAQNSFKVRVTLMSLNSDGTDPSVTNQLNPLLGTVIKIYNDQEISAFLPERSGAYPDGGVYSVINFLDLPSTRDIMVALNMIPPGTPEDSFAVEQLKEALDSYVFYFRVDLDVGNVVAESSETNSFYLLDYFKIVATPSTEDFGQYMGNPGFTTYWDNKIGISAGSFFQESFFPELISPLSSNSELFTGYVWSYALYGSPSEVDARHAGTTTSSAGQTNLLFQEGVQNGSRLIFNRSIYTADLSFVAPDNLVRPGLAMVLSASGFSGTNYSGNIIFPGITNGALSGSLTGSFSLGTVASPGPSTYKGPILLTEAQNGNVVRRTGTISMDLGEVTYPTMSFDFNVRATDFYLDVVSESLSSKDGVINGGEIADGVFRVLRLSPPYTGISGSSSLSGVGGLIDNPYVLSVEGNVTDVQRSYSARITVRDQVPITQRPSDAVLTLRVVPREAIPSSPSNLTANFFSSTDRVRLTWNGTLNAGSYVIERSFVAPGVEKRNFQVLGSTKLNTFDDTRYATEAFMYYRVKAVSIAGVSNYSNEVLVRVRLLGVGDL